MRKLFLILAFILSFTKGLYVSGHAAQIYSNPMTGKKQPSQAHFKKTYILTQADKMQSRYNFPECDLLHKKTHIVDEILTDFNARFPANVARA